MSESLEQTLRDVLHRRAGHITSLPPGLTHLDQQGSDNTELHRTHRHGWLLAAAAVLVIAVAGMGVAQYLANRHPASPNSGPVIADATTPPSESTFTTTEPSTATSPVSSPTTVTATHPTAPTGLSADLYWHTGIHVPDGYQLRERAWTPDYETISLRKLDDPDAVGCCGGLPHTVFVTMYRPGAYDATGVQDGTPVQVGTSSGWFGSRRDQDFDGQTPLSNEALPTVSWQYAPQAWAVVRATTSTTQQLSQLLLVATSVRTDVSEPIRTPLRLSYLPPGLAPDRIYDDTNEIYGTTFEFSGDVTGQPTTLVIQVWAAPGPAESSAGASTITVDGRSGSLLDPSNGGHAAYIRLGERSVEISYDGSSHTAGTDLDKILDGIRWSSDPTNPSTWFDAVTMVP